MHAQGLPGSALSGEGDIASGTSRTTSPRPTAASPMVAAGVHLQVIKDQLGPWSILLTSGTGEVRNGEKQSKPFHKTVEGGLGRAPNLQVS